MHRLARTLEAQSTTGKSRRGRLERSRQYTVVALASTLPGSTAVPGRPQCGLWRAAPHVQALPGYTYAEAIHEARAALRLARDVLEKPSAAGLLVLMPYLPPGTSLDAAARPSDDAEWPGGLSQLQRTGPLADTWLGGWQAECGALSTSAWAYGGSLKAR